MAAQPAPPAPVAPLAVAFARHPGRANNAALDFTQAANIKLYKAATTPMTTLYNLAPIGLHQFLCNVSERSTEYGWDNVLTVRDNDGVAHNILKDYGQVTMANCNTAATNYYEAGNRDDQNSAMLYSYLSSSLTEQARMLVFAFVNEFTKQTTNANPEDVGVGVLLLKTIIGKSVVDSAATIDTLRNSIATLDVKIVDLQSNITQFNLHVINQRNGLTARGESVPELMSSLFKAYGKASDDEFVDYMKTKKYAHFDGTSTETADSLMAKALAHYEASVERGEWNAPNAKDLKSIALNAENAKLKKAGTSTSGRANKNGKGNDDKHAWKKIKPDNNVTTKTVKDRTWFWCKFHKLWVTHGPESCFMNPSSKVYRPPTNTDASPAPNQNLTLDSTSLQTLLEGSADDESET